MDDDMFVSNSEEPFAHVLSSALSSNRGLLNFNRLEFLRAK